MKLSKKKKIIIVIFLITIVFVFIFLFLTHRTVKVVKQETYIKGIEFNEVLKVKTSFGKISKIKLTKEITLSGIYAKDDSYEDAIKDILDLSYADIKDNYKLTIKDHTLTAKVKIKEKGIVLNNVTIKLNGDDKTTLRYDTITDLKDKSSLKIGKKITIKDLKTKLKKLGYTKK